MLTDTQKYLIENKPPSTIQLIVGFKQKLQQDLVDDNWLSDAILIAKLKTTRKNDKEPHPTSMVVVSTS
jgi:hypothetical protein